MKIRKGNDKNNDGNDNVNNVDDNSEGSLNLIEIDKKKNINGKY